MICIIILRGAGTDFERAERRLIRNADKCLPLQSGVWLAESTLDPSELRDFLGDGLDDVRLVVTKLNGRWATKGWKEVSSWLKGARDDF